MQRDSMAFPSSIDITMNVFSGSASQTSISRETTFPLEVRVTNPAGLLERIHRKGSAVDDRVRDLPIKAVERMFKGGDSGLDALMYWSWSGHWFNARMPGRSDGPRRDPLIDKTRRHLDSRTAAAQALDSEIWKRRLCPASTSISTAFLRLMSRGHRIFSTGNIHFPRSR